MKLDKFKSRKEWAAAVWQTFLKDVKNSDLGIVLDSLLSPYEKSIIVNRLAATSLIKKGKTYRQIGEQLWLSSTTIRSLKRGLENKHEREYQSYRLLKNKRPSKIMKTREEVPEMPEFFRRLDYLLENFPKKGRPNWRRVLM